MIADLFKLLAFESKPWFQDAACTQSDPDAWFPDESGATTREFREAKRICASCPVAAQCLAYAIRNNEEHGLWGGKSPKEIRKLRKQMAT